MKKVKRNVKFVKNKWLKEQKYYEYLKRNMQLKLSC